MASLALGIAGIALAPASAGASTIALYAAIGSATGSLIDTFAINPLLNPSQQVSGPRLDDVRVSTASEGSDLGFSLGPENRVPGKVIWFGPLVAVESDEGGGKGGALGGGGGGSAPRTRYFVDVAVAWGDGQVSRITKVWADAKVIYAAGVTVQRTVPEVAVASDNLNAWASDQSVRCSDAPAFAGFLEGKFVRMQGWTANGGRNNGRWRIVTKVSDRKIILERAISGLPIGAGDPLAAEVEGDVVTVTQEEYSVPVSDLRYESIEHYRGTESQMPSSVIEAVRGVGNVPAYRGTHYSVIKRLELTDFGNRPPNMSAVVEADSQISVGEALQKLMARWGFAAEEVDVSRVSGCLRGYNVATQVDGRTAIKPLMAAYNLLVQQVGDSLRFFHRGEEPRTTVPASDLGASSDDGRAVVYNLEDTPGYDLPGEFVVKYTDPATDYQTGSQSYKRVDRVVDGSAELSLPVVMDSSSAQSIARTAVWQSWAERQRAKFSLPPRYWRLLEGEVVVTQIDGVEYSVRISEMNRGANWVVEVSGVVVETAAAQATDEDDFEGVQVDEPAEPGGPPATEPYVAPEVRVEVMDVPALRETDTTVPGAYWAMCAVDPAAQWRGATAQASSGTSYVNVFASAQEQAVGRCLGVLADRPVGYWDRGATLEVEMLNGTLQSVSESAVLEGANWAVVGSEIIGYATAELVGEGRYRVRNMLRGLRGTEWAVPGHSASERFVPVSALTSQFWPYPSGHVGTSKLVRGVAAGATPDSIPGVPTPLPGNTLRQFAPCDVRVERDGSRGLRVRWTRRSRALSRLFAPGAGPLLADGESYEVDLRQGGDLALKLTARVDGATSLTLSASEQTASGIDPAQNVVAEVCQLGPVVGRGFLSRGVVG